MLLLLLLETKLLTSVGLISRPRLRKNGMETARVGINDSPNATRTAGAPDNAIPLAAAEEAFEAVDDDGDDDDDDEVASATSEAGSSCVAVAAPSAAAMAVGTCSSVPADAGFKFTCPCK